MRGAMFDKKMLHDLEAGRLSTRQFYEAFCSVTGVRAEFDRLVVAATDIFEVNLPVVPIVAQLKQAGYRMGVLSNTCDMHWEYCHRQYRIVQDCFDVYALSYKIGAAKPEAAIFQAAAEMVGCQPEEMFFVDDIAGHVVGAKAVGVDAVQFTTAEALAKELRRRGIRFNY